MPLFDAYLMVDWSANSKPKAGKDSIWTAWLERNLRFEVANPSTREEARTQIRALLREAREKNLRTLVGFDFAYAYPKGLAAALGRTEGSETKPWRHTWDRIANVVGDAAKPNNENDRFSAAAKINEAIGDPLQPGPFWGRPAGNQSENLLSSKRPPFPYGGTLESRRLTELALPGSQEVWKLYTAGSVGSQTLLGIPVVRELRDEANLAECSRVWPFETGFTERPISDAGPAILHVEIWPGILEAFDPTEFSCRDEGQVSLLALKLAELDQRGALGAWFAKPEGLSDKDAQTAVEEEGWILGAKAPGSRMRPEDLAKAVGVGWPPKVFTSDPGGGTA